jgi:hypothetical protein
MKMKKLILFLMMGVPGFLWCSGQSSAASLEAWDRTLVPAAFPGLGSREPAKAAPAKKRAKTD